MNIIHSDSLKIERESLYSKFIDYAKDFLSVYENGKAKVCTWEYSLGITKDMISYERLIPSIAERSGKDLKRLTKSNLESKNLVLYGLDCSESVIFLKKKYDKEIEKYGENVRFVDGGINGKFILNARIYESDIEKSKLLSVCHLYKEGDFFYYVSITPENNWSIRVDKMINGKIERASFFATSWSKQIDYDFIYDNEGGLLQIMIGSIIHWKKNE